MADKGIIFSAPMIRALLDGRKTQTRRLLRNPEYYGCPTGDCPHEKQVECDAAMAALSPKEAGYAPGDRLYVRETWHVRGIYSDVVEVGYAASQNRGHTEYVEQWPVERAVPGKGKWPEYPKFGPCIHMPRWASRLWLAVTEVRVQRLQEISEADAIAEGIDEAAASHFGSPIKAYAALWNHLHGADNDQSWEANPWIVVVSFDVHRGNIDAQAEVNFVKPEVGFGEARR